MTHSMLPHASVAAAAAAVPRFAVPAQPVVPAAVPAENAAQLGMSSAPAARLYAYCLLPHLSQCSAVVHCLGVAVAGAGRVSSQLQSPGALSSCIW